MLVEDACSAQDAEQHRYVLKRSSLVSARVRTTDEVLAAYA